MAETTIVNRRLLENIRDEPKQMLQPIRGYEEMPQLPLEEACEPLKYILDEELKQNITIAKMNSEEPEDNLTQDESAAIHLYTMEWTKYENSLYAVLNRTLRQADRSKLKPWFKYLKLLLTALFKLPSTEYTTIWRGVREDLRALYPKGKKITWWALTSCTASISVLESPVYLGKSGERTMFSIQSKYGKCIKAHSFFKNEDEILLAPGRHFEVVDQSSLAPGLYIIHIREIPPPFRLLADPFDLRTWRNNWPQSNRRVNLKPIISPNPPALQPVPTPYHTEDAEFAPPGQFSELAWKHPLFR